MSKFKSYTEKGSFGDNYIKLPDETSKLRAAKEKRLSQMDRAQAFLEKNRSGYLSAQKEVQTAEANQREANEKFQRQARQDYIDALKRDAEIEAKNTQAELQQQEQMIRDIAQFSATAYNAFAELGKQREERRVEQANAIVLQTGLNHSDLVSFTNIDKTFTTQEAFASDEGQRILDTYGDTPQIRAFLENARSGRASHLYLQNKTAILNEVDNKLPGFLSEAIASADPSLSGAQKLAKIDIAVGDFVKQFNVEPRILEGIAGTRIRAIRDQYKNNQAQINAANERQSFTNQRLQVLDSLLGATRDDVKSVVNYITTNPSTQKNIEFSMWAVNGLRSGTLSPEVAYDLFNKEQYLRDGKPTSFRKQFGSTKWYADVDIAINEAQQTQRQAWGQQRADKIMEINARMIAYFDEQGLAQDGYIDRADEKKLEALLPTGFRLEEIPVYNEQLKYLTNEYRAGVEFERELAEMARNKTLSRDFINKQTLPRGVRDEALRMLQAQEDSLKDPDYAFNLDRVKDMVFNEGSMAATVISSYENKVYRGNIDSYQAVLVNLYKDALFRTRGDSDAAAQLVLNFHMKEGGSETGFDPKSGFTYITRQRSVKNDRAGVMDREYRSLVEGSKNFYSSGNKRYIQESMTGELLEDFQQAYNDPGKGIPTYVQRIAELNGRDPLTQMQDLGIALGMKPYAPGNANYQNVIKNLSPLPVDFKLNNTYRYAKERNLRAFNVPSSGRGKFSGQSFGPKLTQVQIGQVAAMAGFTTEQSRMMSAIGMAESEGQRGIDTVQSGLDPDKKNEYSN